MTVLRVPKEILGFRTRAQVEEIKESVLIGAPAGEGRRRSADLGKSVAMG